MEKQEEKLVLELLPAPIYTKKFFWVREAVALTLSVSLAVTVHIIIGVILFMCASFFALFLNRSKTDKDVNALIIEKNKVSFGYATSVDTTVDTAELVVRGRLRHHTEEVKITMTVSRIESVALYRTAYEKKHNQGNIVFWGESSHQLEKVEASDFSPEELEEKLLPQEKGCYTFHGIADFDTLAQRLKPFFDEVYDYS